MKIIRVLLYIFLFIFFTSNVVQAIEEHELFAHKVVIKNGVQLSIADCLATAFKNSPKIKRQKYNLDIAKSNLGIARSQYFPVFQAGVGFYNENNSNGIYYDKTYRNLPSVGVTINKMLWNFGKTTALIKMEKFYGLAAEYEFIDSICATLFDVKAKYYKLLRAKAMFETAKQDLEINKNFIKIARKNPDKETADVNLQLAEIKFIKAENNLKNAQLDLANSMYLEDIADFDIKNTDTFKLKQDFSSKFNEDVFRPQVLGFSADNAVDIAYTNSPDLQVLVNTEKAMEQSLLFVKRTYFPELNANVGYGFNNNNVEDTNNSLQVGVNLTTAVNLMELKHSITKADAEVNIANNEILLFKKDLLFEVKRALNNTDKAQRQIPTAYDTVIQAQEALKIVQEQYKSGILDYTSLQDARKDYINALDEYINSLYNYNMALIQLEMAMHYHITDIHHKSEHAVHYHSDDLLKHLTEALECDEHEEDGSHKHKSKKFKEKL